MKMRPLEKEKRKPIFMHLPKNQFMLPISRWGGIISYTEAVAAEFYLCVIPKLFHFPSHHRSAWCRTTRFKIYQAEKYFWPKRERASPAMRILNICVNER